MRFKVRYVIASDMALLGYPTEIASDSAAILKRPSLLGRYQS